MARILCICLILAMLAGSVRVAQNIRISRDQNKSQEIAARYWNGTKCDGHIGLRYIPMEWRTLAFADYYFVQGSQRFFDCYVYFNSRRVSGLSFSKYCAIMVHEYGHLNGRGHSRNPYSIMYPKITSRNIPKVCD